MEKIGDLLTASIDKLGIRKKLAEQQAIIGWRKIVGDKIAAHAKIVDLRGKVLLLAVDSPVWGHHLLMLKENIINYINKFVGEILVADIKFQAGNFGHYQKKEQTETINKPYWTDRLNEVRLEESETTRIGEISGPLADPELRTKIAGIIRKETALNKLKKSLAWHKCSQCGVLCPPEKKYCTVCTIAQNTKRKEKIRRLLKEVPGISYSELKEYINCSFWEFKESKNEIINKILQEIKSGKENRLAMITLTMLKTGLKPENLKPDSIDNVVTNIRRSKHVFTSRS